MNKLLTYCLLCWCLAACGGPDGIISPVPSPTGSDDNSGAPTSPGGNLGGNGVGVNEPGGMENPYDDAGPPAARIDAGGFDNAAGGEADPEASADDANGACEDAGPTDDNDTGDETDCGTTDYGADSTDTEVDLESVGARRKNQP